MKLTVSRFILLLTFCLAFCCNENESVETETIDPLHGTWNMVNVYGGDLVPIDIDYNIGENLWIIDMENMTITNINNLNPDESCAICNTTYPIIITESDEGIRAVHYAYENEDGELQIFREIGEVRTLTDSSLILQDTEALHGLKRTFIKN